MGVDRQAPHHDSRSATKINTTRPSNHNNPTNHISTTRLRDLTSYVSGIDSAAQLLQLATAAVQQHRHHDECDGLDRGHARKHIHRNHRAITTSLIDCRIPRTKYWILNR